MRNPFLGSVIMPAAAFAAVALTSYPVLAQATQKAAAPAKTTAPAKTAAPAKTWTQPKTPWGDPDLQGTWTSDDCIGAPMNRPVNMGDRLYYTEQELAQR